ncbi:hypothetical protein HDV00_001587 [Rhizophlyctis rosea]|nr:hypothetical protein HDV00_001587 [Rhizophlyctis rosea]
MHQESKDHQALSPLPPTTGTTETAKKRPRIINTAPSLNQHEFFQRIEDQENAKAQNESNKGADKEDTAHVEAANEAEQLRKRTKRAEAKTLRDAEKQEKQQAAKGERGERKCAQYNAV